ncbi:MAG: response regulator [Lachnospiraceae bacterium]|nr:response regulator [Lachnospiraceae bacterium]
MKEGLLKKIIITIFSTLLNVGGALLSSQLNLPFLLGTTGTFVSVVLGGFFPCVISSFASAGILALASVLHPAYILSQSIFSLVVYFFNRKKMFSSVSRAGMSGFWLTLISAALTAPLDMIFGGFYTGNYWGDIVIEMFRWQGVPVYGACILGEVAANLFDKIMMAFLALFVLHYSQKRGSKKNNAAVISALLLFSLAFSSFISVPVRAESTNAYVIYNKENGLLTSEANTIGETQDGTIWIGSYAGLIRFDGSDFSLVRDGGIANVNAILTDSKDRLWVGTNDNGIARLSEEGFTFFNTENGLSSDSIRCFAEGDDGMIYVGTSGKLVSIDKDDRIATISIDLSYISSLACMDGLVYGVDKEGTLFIIKNGRIVFNSVEEKDPTFYYCVTYMNGAMYAGTTTGDVLRVEREPLGKVNMTSVARTPLEDINAMVTGNSGNLWVAGRTGFGQVLPDGSFEMVAEERFASDVAALHIDYQGNLWAASNNYGVLKLSRSAFTDYSENTGELIANAAAEFSGRFYIGGDQGLTILDSSYKKVENPLTEMLSGTRVRWLMEDGDRLWISTYGSHGLIESDGENIISEYKDGTPGLTSFRFRNTLKLSDGTILAGTTDGAFFIKDGKVELSYSTDNGLLNGQILTTAEDSDGSVLLGTDGAGIYVVKDGQIRERIGKENGLRSEIILRLVRYQDGFFVVTSNSIAFLKDGKATTISNFPYFNNYDILLEPDGENAYVLSSAGIYLVNALELKNNDPQMNCILKSNNDGLSAGITANARSIILSDGSLLFCTNISVSRYDPAFEEAGNVKFSINEVTGDGQEIKVKDGVFTVPPEVSVVKIAYSARNYALSDVHIRIRVPDLELSTEPVSFDKVDPLQLTNIEKGAHRVILELLDTSDLRVIDSKEYVLTKAPHIWEYGWFRFYFFLLISTFIVFGAWAAFWTFNESKRKEKLEKQQVRLESKVDEQTKIIKEHQQETEAILTGTVEALTNAVDAKDKYTAGHSRRVALYSREIARRMGKSEEEQELIYRAGLLHDVGKIRVPESVITKPGRLSDEEYALMKLHPVSGFRIISNIHWNRNITVGAKFHHERYDGKGYPDGRTGENIPEIARIIGVADAYDAMTSNRSYRDAMPQEKVRAEIEKGRGTQFDPECADIMLSIIDEDKDYELRQKNEEVRKILVVDSEKINCEIIRSFFSDRPDMEFFMAQTGEESLQIVLEERVDLILVGLVLPDMDGFSATEKLREYTQAPIVFASGDRTIETFYKALDRGAADFITKPFQREVVKEVVFSILGLIETLK